MSPDPDGERHNYFFCYALITKGLNMHALPTCVNPNQLSQSLVMCTIYKPYQVTKEGTLHGTEIGHGKMKALSKFGSQYWKGGGGGGGSVKLLYG